MQRRGPDDAGTCTDGVCCSLGFRRLSILDLTPAGHQPMLTQDGRYMLVFNGEVYNFRELRGELQRNGIKFRSTGDAEVVLYALAQWGTDALRRFNGMFALGFYDAYEQRLLIARDAVGIKPIYYLRTPEAFVFASQYDQILAHPASRPLGVDLDALALYLRLGYIPAPHAYLHHTRMLDPGTWLEVRASGEVKQGRFVDLGPADEPDLRGEEAYEAVSAAVSRAVQRQMVSDVPLGTFLSGGIDSPLVAAEMRATGAEVQAFTIGTQGDELDESEDAARYARALGLQHIVEHATPKKALELLDDAVAACGEPFADYSVFPTLMVSRLARRYVKVILSGDGGDELFWGYYGRFASVLQVAQDFRQSYWLRSLRWGAKRVLGLGNGHRNLRQASIGDWYRAKHTHVPEDWLESIFPDLPLWPGDMELYHYGGWDVDRTAQWLRWNELTGHLTMVLLKVDRASMHNSLEVRVPLLDQEVVETAMRVDWRSCLDLRRGVGKLPLRQALSRHVSYQTTAKRGFSVPMGEWLRGPLRPVFEEALLQRNELVGLPLCQQALRAMYEQHLSGQADYAWGLWVLLSLALWESAHLHPWHGARERSLQEAGPILR